MNNKQLDILEGLKANKEVNTLNEGAMGDFDIVISNFMEEFVTTFFKRMGGYPIEAINALTEHLVKTLGKKIFDMTAKEIQDKIKNSI
jgi:hypothetical protein